METLTADEVVLVRTRLAQTTLASLAFGAIEPLYPEMLASAVSRQHTSMGRVAKYTSVAEVCATLFYGLNSNHAFENGNKRTAMVTLLVQLEKNDHLLVGTFEDELFELAEQTVQHGFSPDGVRDVDVEVAAIAAWISDHCRTADHRERLMRFRDLRSILEDQGCEFGRPQGNFIKVRRVTSSGVLSASLGYPNDHYQVPRGEVRRVRRILKLTEGDGFDSRSFYDLDASVDQFANTYRQLLNRLEDA